MRDYGLPEYDAGVLTASRELGAYYEDVAARVGSEPKLCANWVMGDLAAFLNKDGLEIGESKGGCGSARRARHAYRRQHDLGQDRQRRVRGDVGLGRVSRCHHRAEGAAPDHRYGRDRKSDRRRDGQEPGAARRLSIGQGQAVWLFVGQVMKATGGKANPAQLNDLLKKKLAG